MITICTSVFKDGVFWYWKCQKTDSKEQTNEDPKFVQIGVSAKDWNKGQDYRSEVEEYFKSHNCTSK